MADRYVDYTNPTVRIFSVQAGRSPEEDKRLESLHSTVTGSVLLLQLSVTCINCNMRVGKSFVTYFSEESLFVSCWREVNADWRLSRRDKSSVFPGHCLTSPNRRFPEITGENNLTVFSYSWRVKSPE